MASDADGTGEAAMTWQTKRFVLMGGDNYYPAGGFLDYLGSFDTKEEANEAKDKFLKERGSYSWAHVADLETGDYEGTRGHTPIGELLRGLP